MQDPFLAVIEQDPENTVFKTLHENGRHSYRHQGWPGPKNEQWKYTNLKALQAIAWTSSTAQIETTVTSIPQSVADIQGHQVVLVNGRLRNDLYADSTLPPGVSIRSLSRDKTRDNHDQSSPKKQSSRDPGLGSILSLDAMPLAALNSGQCLDAVVIDIQPGVTLDQPIHIISIAQGSHETAPEAAIIFHPRLYMTVGDGAKIDLVESHVGDGLYFSNTVAEIRLGAGAHCGHYKLQRESMEAFHVAAAGVEVAAKAHYDNFVLQIGATIARNEVRPQLAGENADVRLIGAYIGGGNQHIDNSTFIDHAMPHCASREVYKGVLEDSAHGVFQGKILVRPDAQKTDGYQLNRVLLLSDGAEINSKPELEIYADDVVCSHGATASQIDPEQLFYLKARGLDDHIARGLLVDSFLQEAVAEIRSSQVAAAFSEIVRRRLGTPK